VTKQCGDQQDRSKDCDARINVFVKIKSAAHAFIDISNVHLVRAFSYAFQTQRATLSAYYFPTVASGQA